MAKLSDLLGNAKRTDLIRVVNGQNVPKRGKKKHHSQMSQKEINHLFKQLKSVDRWVISDHALDRLIEKNIEASYDDIVSTIYNAKLVEYHIAKSNGNDDERILLRSKALVNGSNNLHVVYSITKKRIVSVWMNDINDKHSTIDMRDYNRNIRIV